MSASHGLTLFLTWLAFTKGSVAAGTAVLALGAVSALLIPWIGGRAVDRDNPTFVLRAAAGAEAVAAIALVATRWYGNGTQPALLALLSFTLGCTSGLFNTMFTPLMAAATPGRLRPHVLVGLSYDVAKVVGSSAVLALLAVWKSPIPVMAVCLLSLAGWHLHDKNRPQRDATPDNEHGQENLSKREPVLTNRSPLPWAPLVAVALVGLLPGQIVAYQLTFADTSFNKFAALGVCFALGAVAGNLALQRVPATNKANAAAYLTGAVALALAPWWPLIAYTGMGVSCAAYYQITRALVVFTAPDGARGKASGTLQACSSGTGLVGTLIAGSLVGRTDIMIAGGAALMVLAAAIAATPSIFWLCPIQRGAGVRSRW